MHENYSTRLINNDTILSAFLILLIIFSQNIYMHEFCLPWHEGIGEDQPLAVHESALDPSSSYPGLQVKTADIVDTLVTRCISPFTGSWGLSQTNVAPKKFPKNVLLKLNN